MTEQQEKRLLVLLSSMLTTQSSIEFMYALDDNDFYGDEIDELKAQLKTEQDRVVAYVNSLIST